ncbi:hypothetical protein C8Q74DRAFT_1222439 [Fomes fomentarius]|nr:hypothetical protein C8Q74DRAFT_1222439 [Fomes fomentarius]
MDIWCVVLCLLLRSLSHCAPSTRSTLAHNSDRSPAENATGTSLSSIFPISSQHTYHPPVVPHLIPPVRTAPTTRLRMTEDYGGRRRTCVGPAQNNASVSICPPNICTEAPQTYLIETHAASVDGSLSREQQGTMLPSAQLSSPFGSITSLHPSNTLLPSSPLGLRPGRRVAISYSNYQIRRRAPLYCTSLESVRSVPCLFRQTTVGPVSPRPPLVPSCLSRGLGAVGDGSTARRAWTQQHCPLPPMSMEEAIRLAVDQDMEQLIHASSRKCTVCLSSLSIAPYIPLSSTPCLQRIDAFLFSLGFTLILAWAYLLSPLSFRASTQRSILCRLVWSWSSEAGFRLIRVKVVGLGVEVREPLSLLMTTRVLYPYRADETLHAPLVPSACTHSCTIYRSECTVEIATETGLRRGRYGTLCDDQKPRTDSAITRCPPWSYRLDDDGVEDRIRLLHDRSPFGVKLSLPCVLRFRELERGRVATVMHNCDCPLSMHEGVVAVYEAHFSEQPRPLQLTHLSAASVGIMVKQWLNEYSTGLFRDSRHFARLRQYRLGKEH